MHKVGVQNACDLRYYLISDLHNALVNLYAQKNILIQHNEGMMSHIFWEKQILKKKVVCCIRNLFSTHPDHPHIQKYFSMPPFVLTHKQAYDVYYYESA